MEKKLLLFIILVIPFLPYSCKKDKETEPDYIPTPYTISPPKYFPVPDIPDFNPLTKEGIALGRKLYFDPILSTNGLSCSSCHERSRSFSLPVFQTLAGESKSVPPHVNLAWNTEYNWSGSSATLDSLCLGDFEPEFFNTDMPLLVNRLKQHGQYPSLFKQAFNINDVSSLTHYQLKIKIVFALSQFIRTMISSDSRYDRFIRFTEALTPEELQGYIIFTSEKGDCFHCHGYPLLTNNMFMNNGLEANPSGFNRGRFLVTNNVNDIGKFSVPTLRNIALTAPYMHDGRFATLEEVVEFYNSGVQLSSANIDPVMTKPGKTFGLNLTAADKANLVAFLKTFTDTVFINNPSFRP